MRATSAALLALILASAAVAAGELPDLPTLIGLPGQGFSLMDGPRTLREDWGQVTVRLELEGQQETAPELTGDPSKAPYSASSLSRCGSCELRTFAFRAPTSPAPCDAIRAAVTNRSGEAAKARLRLLHTSSAPDLTLSPGGLSSGSRRLIALPEKPAPTLPMNAWGLASNAEPLPGWARPEGPCDAAFRNIRVGWRGEPITYRFAVEPNGRRTVVLGVCESHWDVPKQRPLILQVEGAADVRVDPIGDWGRHVPKCIGFQARDVNGDGSLTVASVTPTDAPDRNSILNAVWIFPASAAEDLEAVKRGERNAAAECYVDCGGEKDQSLYTVGDITYDLELPPNGSQAFTFLVACQGAPAPEGLPNDAAADHLLGSAEALWHEWSADGCQISVPDERVQAAWRASLAAIVMLRGQASKYLIPQPSADPASFSYAAACDITRALDLSGHHREAEGCLLMLWDRPLPQPIAQWAQREDGAWPCPEGNWGAQGRVLSALTSHYLLTRDDAWLKEAYPAVQRGADRLVAALAEHGGRLPTPAAAMPGCEPNVWAARGLKGTGVMAAALGKPDDARRFAQAAGALPVTDEQCSLDAVLDAAQSSSPQGFPAGPAQTNVSQVVFPDAAAGAQFVVLLRGLLVDDTTSDLRLLAGVPSDWLAAEGGVAVDRLPTVFGPLSFRARLTAPGVLKLAITPPPTPPGSLSVALPFEASAGSVEAAPPATAEVTADGRTLRLTLGQRPASVVVRAR